jgi:hypothetical protein
LGNAGTEKFASTEFADAFASLTIWWANQILYDPLVVLIVPVMRTLVPTFPLVGVIGAIATFIALADGRNITKVDVIVSMIIRTVKMVNLFNLDYSIRLISFQQSLNIFTINGTF